METIYTLTITELKKTIINEIIFHLESRDIEYLSLNSSLYVGDESFNKLTRSKVLSVISDIFIDEWEYDRLNVEELDSIMSMLTSFNYVVDKYITTAEETKNDESLISDDVLSSVYYNEVLVVANNHNCVIEKVTERNFVVMVSMSGINKEAYGLMRQTFENVSFGSLRNSTTNTMKGGKKNKMNFFFIIKRSVSVNPLVNGNKGTQVLKLLDTYNITTNTQFDLKLAELVYNMSKYCHTINGQQRKELRSYKKGCIKFLFNRNAFHKIDECESTLNDKLNGFYIGEYSFHLRNHDFEKFFHGCYANQVEIVPEKYDGTKRDLSNINMEFMEYTSVFKDINDVFLNTFLNLNL